MLNNQLRNNNNLGSVIFLNVGCNVRKKIHHGKDINHKIIRKN